MLLFGKSEANNFFISLSALSVSSIKGIPSPICLVEIIFPSTKDPSFLMETSTMGPTPFNPFKLNRPYVQKLPNE